MSKWYIDMPQSVRVGRLGDWDKPAKRQSLREDHMRWGALIVVVLSRRPPVDGEEIVEARLDRVAEVLIDQHGPRVSRVMSDVELSASMLESDTPVWRSMVINHAPFGDVLCARKAWRAMRDATYQSLGQLRTDLGLYITDEATR